jgi:alkylation response protein AidB-like acyl-CoA dehydrogenase
MSEPGPGAAYRPPVEDVMLALDVAGLEELLALDAFAALDRELVGDAVRELGRFTAEVIAPTDRLGDVQGAHLDQASGRVALPEAVTRAYHTYVEAGWGALQFPTAYGGGGFPSVVGLAMQEMLASANLSFSLNPVLTQSAIELLLEWGDESQRARFVPKLLTGAWCGTMDLTEPEAGSDLAAVATRAEPAGDGTWRVHGTKIFITWGEHDLAENIVHLVLARTPGAGEGTRGLSLFLVPKRLVAADGAPSEPNALGCVRLEEKLGIHLAPTCVMSYDGALAELVGPERAGMRAMFTMMNRARLSIGAEGPAVGERAYQQALAYAGERRQGRASGVQPPRRSTIIEHPDVRRMLLDMRTSVLASRLVLYSAASQGDLARHSPDPAVRELAQSLVDLLTPVAKAWATDLGVEVASTGIQVLGGIGYVEEAGMAQRLRDARIAPIYEGTNGIQAIDLVLRKVPRRSGAAVQHLLGLIEQFVKGAHEQPGGEALGPTIEALGEAHEVLSSTTAWLIGRAAERPDDALAGATAYLELLGVTLGGWLLGRRAQCAGGREVDGGRAPATTAAAVAAAESNFYAARQLGRATGLRRAVTAGAASLAIPLDDGG